jgi:hypothetical protein
VWDVISMCGSTASRLCEPVDSWYKIRAKSSAPAVRTARDTSMFDPRWVAKGGSAAPRAMLKAKAAAPRLLHYADCGAVDVAGLG